MPVNAVNEVHVERSPVTIYTPGCKVAYRIAFCMPVLRSPDSPDSSFLQQWLIAQGMRRRGHRVAVLAPFDLEDVALLDEDGEQEILRRGWTDRAWFGMMARAAWRIQRLLRVPYLNVFSNLRWSDAMASVLPEFDVVQERNGLYKMAAGIACRRLGMPLIYFVDADDLLEHDLFGRPLRSSLRKWASLIFRFNLRTASKVVCLSRAARKHLSHAWKIPEEKIAVFPNGVDVDRFRPGGDCKREMRRHMGLHGEPIVVFVGSYFPYQDVKTLLQAFALLGGNRGNAQMLLIGEGGERAKMEQYAADLGIGQYTKFLGFRPHAEIARLLEVADIGVAPYGDFSEGVFLGSSMKIVEYMASGLAVAASAVGQVRETIRDGMNGILVRPADPGALAGVLQTLISDRDLRLRLGQEARKDAEERYSWARYCERLEALYADVLAGGGRRNTPPLCPPGGRQGR